LPTLHRKEIGGKLLFAMQYVRIEHSRAEFSFRVLRAFAVPLVAAGCAVLLCGLSAFSWKGSDVFGATPNTARVPPRVLQLLQM
jgi:hypothetical protein